MMEILAYLLAITLHLGILAVFVIGMWKLMHWNERDEERKKRELT
jgi:NhaP-type Na+/H+ or K+/H+ antiporter